MVCQLCKKDNFKNLHALATHISKAHKGVEIQKYYDQFISNENVKCPECGELRQFKNLTVGYLPTCGNNACRYANAQTKREKTNIEKYGVKNPFQNKEVKEKTFDAYKKKTGYSNPLSNPEVVAKRKENLSKKYGEDVTNVFQLEEVKQKSKKTLQKHYGYDVSSPTLIPEIREKQISTTEKNHNKKSILEIPEVREKGYVAQQEKYGTRHFLQSDTFRENRTKYLSKQYQTNIKKYGGITPSSDPQTIEKQCKTKRERGTFNTSKVEESIYELLSSHFENIKRQYKDSRYPFACDFYLPTIDTFIEVDNHWTHGPEPYNPANSEHQNLLAKWYEAIETKKSTSNKSKYYELAIKIWTKKDPEKTKIAQKNGIHFVIFKTVEDAQHFCNRPYQKLSAAYTDVECSNEMKILKKNIGSYAKKPYMNRIVLTYQPHFYEKEQDLFYRNSIVRSKLIINREHYLNKSFEKMTDREILRGFKISGIYRGFSHFSPFWAKAFNEEYRPAVVYDPFGGWGHRLLGFIDTPYLYNDFDSRSGLGVQKIIERFNLKDKKVFCFDAYKEAPNDYYDTVFTCPPYYNTEVYHDNAIQKSYTDWLDEDWRSAIRLSIKPTVKLFAFIVIDRMAMDLKQICEEEGLLLLHTHNLGIPKGSHFVQNKQHFEQLLVFQNQHTNTV